MSSAPIQRGDRVYVAARFERQAEARDVADELVLSGFRVTSRWLFSPGIKMGDPASARLWAERDLEDVRCADVYLLLSDDVLGRGGKDFEGGAAWVWKKRLIVVGPPAHVFHYLPDVIRYRSFSDLLSVIVRMSHA
jgi:hypothetical protein